jgi:hypothetical protein
MAPSPSSALAVSWRFHRPARFMAFSTALRSMGLAVPKYAMASGASARSSKMRSACADRLSGRHLSVTDNLDALLCRIDQIERDDLHTLRLRTGRERGPR